MAIEIMDEGRKRWIAVCSVLPLLFCLLTVALHLGVFRDRAMADHIALSTETYRHFAPLLAAYALASLVCLSVLLYFIAHLLRLKTMSPGQKLFWAVILTMFMPLSFPLFWYSKIRREPRRLDVYPGL